MRITVMGPAVILANRLREFAESGQVLVNDGVCKSVIDRFDFNKLEPLPIRGSKETLPAFELLGRKRKKVLPVIHHERKIASVMVGREPEFHLLAEQIRNLLNGQGAIINIVGKPGIGKSRLAAELKAQEWIRKAALLEGRAQSMGRNLSFHPLIYILKTWAGILEDDPAGVATNKLRDSILRVAKEQSGEIFPFTATMMGLPLEGKHRERVAGIEGEALEKLILKNLRDLLASAAAVRPLVILLEDLHWADRSTILFLESIFRMVRQHPILFINIFRPGYEETGDYLLNYMEEQLPDRHSTLILESLNETESRELIQNLLNRTLLPAEVNELIIRKTEGNPFFIEEIIRSFIDAGIVEVHEHSFRVTEKIREADIPASINEVILSRVDKLDEKTRELLKTASVIGRNFYFKVLEEAADTISELDERLEYLKEVQLISESKQKEEIEYLFRHALAQQATYESILQNSKKDLHLKIARSIEKVFAGNLPEFYGTLAYHYEKAENLEKTEEYLVKAGDEALKSAATSDAIRFYEHALNAYSDKSSDRSILIRVEDIYYKLVFAYHTRGLNKEALEAVDKALAIYGYRVPRQKFPLMLAFFSKFILFVVALHVERLFFKKTPTEATDAVFHLAYYRAVALSMQDPKRFFIETFYFGRLLTRIDLSKSPRANALFVGFSIYFFWTGISLKIAGRIFRMAERYESLNQANTYLRYRYLKKMYEYHCGTLRQDDDLDAFIETAVEKGSCWEVTAYLLFSGFIAADLGDRELCRKLSDEISKISEHFESSHARVQYYRYLSGVLVKFRETEQAMELLEPGTRLPESEEYDSLISVFHSNLARLHTLRGDLKQAQSYLQMTEKKLHKIRFSKPFYSAYLMAKAQYLMALLNTGTHPDHNAREVRNTLTKLIRTARKLRGILPETLLLLAQAEHLLGNRKHALRTLNRALKIAEHSGARVDLSRIYFEMARLLNDPETKTNQFKGHPSFYYLDKAKRLFEEMNLQWDLELLRGQRLRKQPDRRNSPGFFPE